MAEFWAMSLWTHDRAAQHLILLSFIFYAVLLHLNTDEYRLS